MSRVEGSSLGLSGCQEMQLYKSFAYIKDKTRDEKSQSAEVRMEAEDVDDDDAMGALQRCCNNILCHHVAIP